ncbi:helix-turn-helix domain-containing protein [Rhizobium rhizogenes]|uniref:helix-turn-helix domain-containing protein n=1 Tax=Rhizobium rhizogenes TaxID=359 RepID=UPI00193CFF25|nr:helix-turn-helix domain-containing protein [Rhizobium rhizogenes]QRM36963.1 helix-turn-helix domain-containing protein [Rhizobium rhizogenes]
MSNARFSIIPAWIVTDTRLKGSDLKVLCLLGTYTNKEGWCRRSQVKMAEQLGCGRSTVQDSLNRLSDIGAVEKRKVDSVDGRDSAHWYRVILDRVVGANVFTAFDEEDEEEFGPISGLRAGETPAGTPAPPAGIPAPPAGPRPAPPAGSGPAPINDTLNDPSNDRERGRDAGDEDSKKIIRDFKRWYPTWPTYIGDSEDAAQRAFFALSAEERATCLDRTPDFIKAVKAIKGGKFTYASVYLKGKAWEKLGDPKSELATPVVHNPYSRAWMALRLAELLKPMATAMPVLTAFQRAQVASGGDAARQVERERREKYGWPKVNTMHEFSERAQGSTVPAPLVVISEGFEKVHRDSDLAAAWRDLHARKGWPWLPIPSGVNWLFFPAGEPAEAMAEFERAISEGRSNDDA